MSEVVKVGQSIFVSIYNKMKRNKVFEKFRRNLKTHYASTLYEDCLIRFQCFNGADWLDENPVLWSAKQMAYGYIRFHSKLIITSLWSKL